MTALLNMQLGHAIRCQHPLDRRGWGPLTEIECNQVNHCDWGEHNRCRIPRTGRYQICIICGATFQHHYFVIAYCNSDHRISEDCDGTVTTGHEL
ncbi:hypothetical protein PGT21_033580 [Puccinia graminis f. sp. tritici]|uniref:Uncharacterized protein n=1 Tax=Puccinia graminis f. sp. tritici TaxID=56615 RepID=A0A5B0MAI0_PUCGR|nr:hypothetical protein PGTUg99_006481 [Puccinia graminis f. sp. tritici]KAA1084652.1 hypothetical protein PGT21_033580 [Puccinia graminis f. sp. tritici]